MRTISNNRNTDGRTVELVRCWVIEWPESGFSLTPVRKRMWGTKECLLCGGELGDERGHAEGDLYACSSQAYCTLHSASSDYVHDKITRATKGSHKRTEKVTLKKRWICRYKGKIPEDLSAWWSHS